MKKTVILIGLLLVIAYPAHSQEITDYWNISVTTTDTIGGGTGFENGTWYVYESGWINQWFYDHELDFQRGKIIHIEFDYMAVDPTCPSDITVALNWSTPDWSYLGYGTALPPLPGEVGADEDLYIIRVPIIEELGYFEDWVHVEWDYIIEDYNPEWVSIDVMGCNYEIINGVIVHECAVGTETTTWGAIKADVLE
jgi:hypothetical protein